MQRLKEEMQLYTDYGELNEKLKNALLPLHEKLLKNNTYENIYAFCVQWGSEFPEKGKEGILFIGKSANQFYCYE